MPESRFVLIDQKEQRPASSVRGGQCAPERDGNLRRSSQKERSVIFTQRGLSHAERAGVFTPVWQSRPDAGDARFDGFSGRAEADADNLG